MPAPAVSSSTPAPEPEGDAATGGAAAALRAEQAHLARARAELVRMREHTLSLQASGGDALAGEALSATLWRRAQALLDDPGTTLFFGRTDAAAAGGAGERLYIGRRHVTDEGGDPVIIDWRAEVATPFYRASPSRPMGLWRRRRFGVEGGQLTAFEDELLDGGAPAATQGPGASAPSALLAREIERPRVGPMRDIVATIQPEQDEIVRADLATTVCVQGAPGTGKTAVGLHRAAWLLYAHRQRLARSGVLVVGPNRAFLEHVGAVLPALGEVTVRHTTIDELVAREGVRVRAVDSPAVAVLKGEARMATVLREAVWSHVGRAEEALVVPRGSRRWRVSASQVQQILDELRSRGVRYEAARAMLPQRLAHAVLVQLERSGDAVDDRVHDAVARSAPVRAYVRSLWPPLDPRQVLFEVLATGAHLAEDQRPMVWPRPPRGKGSARWSAADLVLLDEVADLIARTPSLGHVVLDEAQDLSAMQLRAVGRRAATGSLTVLGDLAQGTTPWASDSWEQSLAHLGALDAHLEVLDRGFRVPAAVLDFAAQLLPHMAPGLGTPVSVRSNPGRLELVAAAPGELPAAVVTQVERAASVPGSVGVIVADGDVGRLAAALSARGVQHDVTGREEHADAGKDAGTGLPRQVQLVPATLAKGLEFDHVVAVEPAAMAAAEPDERTGLRRLYVVLTRAVSDLTVVHERPLPEALVRTGDPLTPGRAGGLAGGRAHPGSRTG
ncbi:HelD family protein [Ornithinicoccus halotolerans]|uniref:HelD family protein n=1 Tax=Ornithinicoccus halotolerans TaxID=1748220 RepID=UPI00129701BB|nr:AAA family ATPase [Ornithinicoccus halotolerans]